MTGLGEGVDRALGERAVVRVQVERGERRLLQVERDRPREPVGLLSLGQLVRHPQVETLPLALGERVVGHVAEHVGARTATRPVARRRGRGARPPRPRRAAPCGARRAGTARRGRTAPAGRPRPAARARGRTGESWSMRAAITACTVGGRSRPLAAGPRGGRSRSSRRSMPTISTMKNGLPPACWATRSASSCRRSPASIASSRGMAERERLHPEADRVRDAAGPARTLLEELPPGHAEHHQRHLAGFLHELLDQIQQQRVGLLEILEDEHHRSLRRQPRRAR